jgi:hypothetical protein
MVGTERLNINLIIHRNIFTSTLGLCMKVFTHIDKKAVSKV